MNVTCLTKVCPHLLHVFLCRGTPFLRVRKRQVACANVSESVRACENIYFGRTHKEHVWVDHDVNARARASPDDYVRRI